MEGYIKRSLPSLLCVFIFINGLLLAACAGFYWFPIGSELIVNANALTLQERRYAIKEQNLINLEKNKQALDALQLELDKGKPVLLPYPQLLPELVIIRSLAETNKLTEVEFHMNEPVYLDTAAHTAVIIDTSAVYYGDYEALYKMAGDLLESKCHIKALSVFKNKSQLAVSFSLYGVTE